MSRRIGKIECAKEVFELLTKAFYRDINHATLRILLQIPTPRGIEYSDIEAAFEWVEPKRWRAEANGTYYFVSPTGAVAWHEDYADHVDNNMYVAGNYFENITEAEIYAEKWRELFKENT